MPHVAVGIGTYTGDVSVMRQLLRRLPRNDDVTYVLVQPSPPEAVSSATPLPIEAVHGGEPLQADHIHWVDPTQPLTICDGHFDGQPAHETREQPIDRVFGALARDFGDRAAGLLLGGRGVDGTAGLRAIRGTGGLTLALIPTECSEPQMTSHAIDAGVVDMAVPLARMEELVRSFLANTGAPSADGDDARLEDEVRTRIVSLINVEAELDAHAYRAATLDRRIQRRMLLLHIDDPRVYAERVGTDTAERRALVRDLLTGVTEFFRDPRAFEALRAEVIEPTVRDAAEQTTIRCWIAACSTGQEVYSVGMEWLESFRAHEKDLRLQIFATDVNKEALQIAAEGVYDASMMGGVSDERRERYFIEDGGRFKVRPQLRRAIAFMAHDLTSDPPFSRMSMVSCRNMLIYVRTEVQQHVLRSLRFALSPGGVLMLGSSESPGEESRYFETLSSKWRLYRRRSKAATPDMLPMMGSPRSSTRSGRSRGESRRRASKGSETLSEALLDALVPPTVIVTPDGMIRYSHGDLRPYLHFPRGDDLTFRLPTMLSDEVGTRARTAWHRCRSEQTRVVTTVAHRDGVGRTRITAVPLPRLRDGAIALSFEPIDDSTSLSSGESAAPAPAVSVLEAELEATRDDLRTTIAELETYNEQLWAYNADSARMNEELQRANEELESSTEELRSLNEELSTVNAQLRLKVEQLDRARNDMANFLSSTQIPTIILNEALEIERLTPAASQQLGLHESHCNWFVGNVARPALGDDLVKEARSVLDDLRSRSREMKLDDGRVLERRVHPYLIESRRVAGVVVTWVDISAIRRASDALEKSEERLRLATAAANLGTFDVDLRAGTETWTPTLKRIFGLVPDALVPGNAIEAGYIHRDDVPKLREKLMRSFDPSGDGTLHSEHRIHRTDGEIRWVFVKAQTFFEGEGEDRAAVRSLGMAMDITERKHAEERLAESEARIRRLFDQAPALIAMHEGPQHVYVYSNPLHDRAVGGRRLVGLPLREAMPELEGQGIFERFDRVFETGEAVATPAFGATFDRDGDGMAESGHYTQVLQPWFDPDGQVAGIMSFAFEVTVDAQSLQTSDGRSASIAPGSEVVMASLRASQEELRRALQRRDDLLAQIDSELDEPLAAIRVAIQALQSLDLSHTPHRLALQMLVEQADRLTTIGQALRGGQELSTG